MGVPTHARTREDTPATFSYPVSMARGWRIVRRLSITLGVLVLLLVAAVLLANHGYRGEAQIDLHSGQTRRVSYFYGLEFPGEPVDSELSNLLQGERLAEGTRWTRMGTFRLTEAGHGQLAKQTVRAEDLALWVRQGDFADEARNEVGRRVLLAMCIGADRGDPWFAQQYLDALYELRRRIEARRFDQQRVELEDLPTLDQLSD